MQSHTGSQMSVHPIEGNSERTDHLLGLDENRVKMVFVSAAEGDKFAAEVNKFADEIRKIGPNPIRL